MAIAGSVKDDLKFFYPDGTGFMFDTRPCDVSDGRGAYGAGKNENIYGARYMEISWNKEGGKWADEDEHVVSKYNGWLNWLHKYQIDNRFLAVSDKNSCLYQFPEVQYPWKFTEYIFQGKGSGFSVVEPPLYDPSTLMVVNNIENPISFTNEYQRREGKLKGIDYGDVYYEKKYIYKCKYSANTTLEQIKSGKSNPGPDRKQYEPNDELRAKNGDLESGLIIDGKIYPPWIDPAAHPLYKNTFINTNIECGVKRVFSHTTPNRGSYSTFNKSGFETVRHTGIRLYRKDILAKCIDIGQHGNIPPYTINMSGPKDYFDPEAMYRNAVEVVVTYEAGQAMYATDSGTILYNNTNNGNTTVSICGVAGWNKEIRYASGHDGDSNFAYIYWIPASMSAPKEQPKPRLKGSGFYESCKGKVSGDLQNGDLVHRGCAFFKGNSEGCYCSIKRDMLERGDTPVSKPEDFDGIFANDSSNSYSDYLEDPSSCMSFSPGEGCSPIGKLCRYYVEQGPQEVYVFFTDGISNDDMAKMTGWNQAVKGSSDTAMDCMSLGMGGFMGGLALYAATPDAIEGTSTSLSGMSVRSKVTYNYKKVDLNGKEVVGAKTRMNDTRTVKPGTGKFALDKQSTSVLGGVDSTFFTGTNVLSRNRWCSSVMQCYNAKYCKEAYGNLNFKQGLGEGTFAGVGKDNHYCRYYNQGCPTSEINMRAKEYDREYNNLIKIILGIFREYGVGGFDGLSEVKCGNYFAAVGSCSELSEICSVRGKDGSIYFLYKTSKDDPNHKKSDVFAFIRQYGVPTEGSSLSENSYFKMSKSKYKNMGELPDIFGSITEIPWLVKLHDDYVSPTKFESYATNLLPFIGGRMPEYRDYSKMGEEIQCEVTIIEPGYDGDLTSGKGGEDNRNDYTEKKSYQYYRVDATGEWAIEDLSDNGDGISIGTVGALHGQARVGLAPGHSQGAIPIKGSYQDSSYSQERGQIQARVTRGWCFSNDTRKSLEEDKAFVQNDNGEPVEIANAKPAENCLPIERDWYYCPKCSPKPYSYFDPEQSNSSSSSYDGTNAYGEPNIPQIFTDFEFQQYVNCPRCKSMGIETPLKMGGVMIHLPRCRAEGVVNYFGLPGEIIDERGFFWKNHTEVSRSFVSEIFSKNGTVSKGGTYKREDSTNGAKETAVKKMTNRGSNIVEGYLTGERYKSMINDSMAKGLSANESVYTRTDVKIRADIVQPSFMSNNERASGDGLKYNDRYVNPYGLKGKDIEGGNGDGLDFISANTVKNIRNMVMPIQAFPCYSYSCEDANLTRQSGYKDRFTNKEKDFVNKRTGYPSFVMASNEAKNDANYVQFWDGTLIPGKCVRAYYPTSPLWWYRHDVVGGIRRSGGKEGVHFNSSGSLNGTNEYGYTGNVITGSYHMIHGWLPLDKEVIRATISFTPSYYPDCPPVGRTQKGGPMHRNHWHSFTAAGWPASYAGGEPHDKYDGRILAEVMGWSDDVTEEGNPGGDGLSDQNYIPSNYDGSQFIGGDKIISQYNDTNFGFNTNQSWLTWNGYGTDIVMNVTEDSIWKKYTFDEFKNITDMFTTEIGYEVDDPTKEWSVQDSIYIMPPEITDGFLNNAGQAITNMFDLTGLNSSKVYNKNGMKPAEKITDTSWAEGGQIIIQGDVSAQEDTEAPIGVDTLSGINTTLGIEQTKDITKTIKHYYDERISRSFKCNLGVPYSGIGDWIRNNKVNLDGDVDKNVNYRHFNNSCGGYWLNSMAFYPELDDKNEFPTIDEGMEYVIKPLNICNLSMCGSIYMDMINQEGSNSSSFISEYTKEDGGYYNYSPHVLCIADSDGKPSRGSINSDLKPVTGNGGVCKMASYSPNNLYFVLNLSRYPAQTSHLPYRNERGSWNVSNAICTNADCFVCQDGRTVAEAAALSNGVTTRYRNKMFSMYSTQCGNCKSDLTKSPGAMYTGGDGIETWKYGEVPQKDNIVNGFLIETNNMLCKCGFDIFLKSSTDSYWEKMVSVDYDYNSGKYIWKEFRGTALISKSGNVLPLFKGVWKDGYNSANEDLTGYHFIAKRACMVKVVGHPLMTDSSGNKLANDGMVIGSSDIVPFLPRNIMSNRYKIKSDFMNIGDCEGGYVVISGRANKEIEIQSYNKTTREITLKEAIPDDLTLESASEFSYQIKMKRYIFTVNKFQVYGFEVGSYVTMTDDASTCVIPLHVGTVSSTFYDRATKMLRVRAINGTNSLYNMIDTDKLNYNSLRYKVEYDSSIKKYRIISGEFFYDTYTNTVYFPYLCEMETGGSGKTMDATDIDNVYTSDKIDKTTLPSAIEFKYMTNNGNSVDVSATSIGEGPSYLLERDTITEIGIIDTKTYGSIGNTLPSIGKSVFLRRQGKRVDINWLVTNKERTNYSFGNFDNFIGTELAREGVTHSSFNKFMGGDETKNGIGDNHGILSGKATTTITITGLPNCIMSGILYVSAKAIREQTYRFAGKNTTIRERTGGLKNTGFAFIISKMEQKAEDKEKQSLSCCAITIPKIVVYLKERDSSANLE